LKTEEGHYRITFTCANIRPVNPAPNLESGQLDMVNILMAKS